MKKIIAMAIGLCLIVSIGYSQQERHYTQFMYNKLSFNPGYAGSYEHPCATAIYRNQWLGLEGAPKSVTVSFDMPFKKNMIGIGANVHATKIGISTKTTLEGIYAYGLKMETGRLAIGFQPSVRYLRNNYEDSRLEATDGLEDDNSIPMGQESKILPNFGVGVFYSNEQFYLGLSVPRLFESNIDFSEATPALGKEFRHVYGMAGVIFALNDNLQLQPQVLLKYAVDVPVDLEVNVNMIYKDLFTFGTTYRMGGNDGRFGESIDFIASINVTPVMTIGISYDLTLSELRRSNSGSLEAIVRYCFVREKTENIINPRFF